MVLCEEAPLRIRKFTEDEIRQANSVDILSLARRYGYEPEKAGRKAVHMKHSGGLYLFPRTTAFFQWMGPDDGIKGGAIDFVMREENLSFPGGGGQADWQGICGGSPASDTL